MPVSFKQLIANRRNALKHGLYSHFSLDRALQFLSPKNRVRYLSAFINELFPGYSGNKSKTHSDLSRSEQNPPRPRNVRQKKNKPISCDPSQSPQPLLRQKNTGKKSRSEMI